MKNYILETSVEQAMEASSEMFVEEDSEKNGRDEEKLAQVMEIEGKEANETEEALDSNATINLHSSIESQLANFGEDSEKHLEVSDEERAATLPDPLPQSVQPATDLIMERESLRDQLTQLALKHGCMVFKNKAGETFATIPINNHKETHRIASDAFRRWLRHIWLTETGCGVSTSVVNDTCDTFDTLASYGKEVHEVFLRVAHQLDSIYVDLGDDMWRTVQIEKDGWQIIEDPPIRFIRTSGMLPYATPIRGGNVDALREHIHAPTDRIWCLLIGWLLGSFSEGPFPILIVQGEQGSGKSLESRKLRKLIDPSEAELQTTPREARDLMIAAQNSYLICIDNQSKVPDWESDLLCGLSTGIAQRERKYHTNDGSEQLFKAKRPIILNGIDLALRDDLLSRSVLVSRPPISDTQRQDEKQLLARFESAIPELLGVIFDILSSTLRELPNTTLESKPRMADFALWVTAAEKALGWEPGTFMRHYDCNRSEQAELAIESDPFGQTLREFLIARNETEWLASWQQIISIPSSTIERKGWPTTAKAVTTRLKRLAPALREVGIHFSQERNGAGRFYKFWMDVSNVSKVSSINEESVGADHLQLFQCVPHVMPYANLSEEVSNQEETIA